MENMLNGLYIVATPIGNLGDISARAVKTLEASNFIICENPNHSKKLLSKLGIKKKLIPLHDHNEHKIIISFGEKIKKNIVSLISDAGSPLISDPGYKLVSYCIQENIYITTVPGATAIISALQLSGLPLNEFNFLGFSPKPKKGLSDFIQKICEEKRTSVFFTSTHKIKNLLDLLVEKLSTRRIAICKEITKLNEKTFIGLPNQIIESIYLSPKNLRGEFVVIVEGKKGNDSINNKAELIIEQTIKRILEKFSLTETVEIVHKITYIEKKKIYKKALEIKNEQIN